MNSITLYSDIYKWLLIALAPIMIAGFWVIDHTPFASDYYKEHSIVAESENRTADRIESVNFITAPARIAIGILGMLFLLIPPRENLKWGGPVVGLMLLFFAYTGTTALWSINTQVSLQKFLVLCFFAVAAYGVARQFAITELATLYTVICLAFIFVGVAAELVLGNFRPYESTYRFVGTCHPNSLAVYGSFCCLTTIAFFNRNPILNRWLLLLFAIGFTTLLMTKSRTTLAGFAVASFVTYVLTFKPNNRVIAFSTAMLLLILMGFVIALSRGNLRNAVAEKLAMGRTKDVSTLTGRLPLWELLLESVEKRPVVGHGYLAFWDKDRIEFLSDQLQWEIPHGHNMYIDVMLDGGLVGLFAFAACLMTALALSAFRSLWFTDQCSILVCGFVTFAMVHGLAESLFKLPTFLLFMLVSLVLRMAMEPFAEKFETPPMSESQEFNPSRFAAASS